MIIKISIMPILCKKHLVNLTKETFKPIYSNFKQNISQTIQLKSHQQKAVVRMCTVLAEFAARAV